MSKQHEIFAVATPMLACRGAGLPAVVFQAPEAGLALQPGLYGAEQSSRRTGLALERGLEAALGLGLSPPASPLSSTSLRAFPLNFHEHISFYPRMTRHQLGQAHILSFQTTLFGPCDPQLMGLNVI